jgi:hypothetical protein
MNVSWIALQRRGLGADLTAIHGGRQPSPAEPQRVNRVGISQAEVDRANSLELPALPASAPTS